MLVGFYKLFSVLFTGLCVVIICFVYLSLIAEFHLFSF
jgi:hypothetical protein